MRPTRSQVHAGLHILGRKTGICDRPGLKYLTGFIFWIGKQVLATARQGTGCRYTSGFIFWVGKQVPAIAKPGIRCRYTPDFIF